MSSLFTKFLFLSFMSLFFSSYSIAQETKSGTLTINVNGVKNQTGKIRISIYNSADGFPNSPNKAKYFAEGVIKDKSSIIEIKDLPYGSYAVSLIHDENNNLKVETNFLGIPKEGIGMSNDAKGTFGPPSFDEAKFNFSKENQVIKINMVYY